MKVSIFIKFLLIVFFVCLYSFLVLTYEVPPTITPASLPINPLYSFNNAPFVCGLNYDVFYHGWGAVDEPLEACIKKSYPRINFLSLLGYERFNYLYGNRSFNKVVMYVSVRQTGECPYNIISGSGRVTWSEKIWMNFCEVRLFTPDVLVFDISGSTPILERHYLSSLYPNLVLTFLLCFILYLFIYELFKK